MPLCCYSDDALFFGVTPVDNLFITEYMPKAGGDYIKAYLYGLMQCHASHADDGDLASALNMDEKSLAEAFSYWQEQGLLRITSAEPLIIEYLPIKKTAMAARTAVPQRRGAFLYALSAALGGRVLTGQEAARAIDWVEVFGLTEEAAELMARYCIERKGKRTAFAYMDKVAKSWADAGVLDLDAAQKHIRRLDEIQGGAARILERWRKPRRPTEDELALYEKWTRAWGFTEEAILSSCSVMTATDNPNFKYLDRVLDAYRFQGSVTREAVERCIKEQDALVELGRMVFKRAGINRSPHKNEREQIEIWHVNWGFSPEMLLLAAEYASATSTPFATMKKTVNGWHERGIATVSAAKEAQERKTDAKDARGASPYTFNYQQHGYSDEVLKGIGVDLFEEEGGGMNG